MAGEDQSVELGDYLGIIRRRYVVVGFAVLLCFGLGVAYGLTRPDVYRSRAQVALPASTQNANTQARLADVQTELQVIRSDVVAERAAVLMPGDATGSELLTHLVVEAPTEARVINILYTAADGATAQAGAQAFADAYLQVREQERRDSIEQRSATYQESIDSLEQAIVDAETEMDAAPDDSLEERRFESQRDRLADRQAQLNIELAELQAEAVDVGTIITPARLPGQARAQGLGRLIAASLAAGLLLGLGAAVVLDRLDTRVRGAADLEQTLGVRTLGLIPAFPDRYRKRAASLVTVHAPGGPEADAFRRLRTTVLLAMRENRARTVAITSSVADEGKTTVAANLAVALAQGGRRVLLVSADLRRSGLEAIFEFAPEPGLSDVLIGRVSIPQVERVVGELVVIPRGRGVPNPTDLLGSESTAATIDALAEHYDLVIFDTPPVLAVADVLVLAPRLDVTLLVVSVAEAATGEVHDALTELNLAGANVLGAVVNNAAKRGASSAAAYGVK
ncbi:MAG: polysaccharide biosynthesis tyrosine autokinase [Acidimicrobiales bacterium]|nr:polysaccharide biosynthesis tyrosine autokinase [Acidimicrobiales bacterium]